MDDSALQPFLERLADAVGHDLRSPLGAVINYASLLEDDPALAVDHVHQVAGRIRLRAMEVAEMATLTVDALLLVVQRRSPERCDPAALLRSIGEEVDPRLDVRRSSRGDGDGGGAIEFDRALFGFVWRAFLRFDGSLRSRPPPDLEVRVLQQGRETMVEVGLDGAIDAELPVVGLDRFARSADGKIVPSRLLALQLGGEAVGALGGALELFGSPGKAAGVRLRIPST